MRPAPLTQPELNALDCLLPGWSVDGIEIYKTFTFPTYLAGIHFVNALAHAAEEANHHPDLQIGWRTVTVRLSTHSEKALTALDVDLARKADVLRGQQ